MGDIIILYLASKPDLKLLLHEIDLPHCPELIAEVNPAHALERINKGGIDCVVTENRLHRRGDGPLFVEAVKQVSPETPVVVYADSGPESNKEQLLNAGADEFYWQTSNPKERRRIRETIIRLARLGGPSAINHATRKELEQFIQLTNNAFAMHDFKSNRNILYPGFTKLDMNVGKQLTVDDAFEMIHQDDLPRVIKKNQAIIAKQPWAFDSLSESYGTFSEQVRFRGQDGRITYCRMTGAAVFDGDQLVKMFNSLSDVTAEVEHEWQLWIKNCLVQSESAIELIKKVCHRLIDETECKTVLVAQLSSPHSHDIDILYTDSDNAVDTDNSQMLEAHVPDLVERMITDIRGIQENRITDPEQSVYVESVNEPKQRWFAASPIISDTVFYGVLTIACEYPVTDFLKRLLRSLATMIAQQYRVESYLQALQSDMITEISADLGTNAHFLAELFKCKLISEDTKIHAIEIEADSAPAPRYVLEFNGITTGAEDLAAALARLDMAKNITIISESDGKVTLGASIDTVSINSLLIEYASVVERLSATTHGVEAVVHIFGQVDVSTVIDKLKMEFPNTVFRSRTELESPLNDPSSFGLLTEQEKDVLKVATLSGFFERPQRATAEEIGEVLDVSRTTVLHHLRKAENRIFTHLIQNGSLLVNETESGTLHVAP